MKRMFRTFGGSLLLLVAVALVGAFGSVYSAKKSRLITDEAFPSLSHLAMANQCRGYAFMHMMLALGAKSPEEFESHRSQVNRYSDMGYEELSAHAAFFFYEGQEVLYSDLISERESYVKKRDEVLTLAAAGRRDEALTVLSVQLMPIYERYLERGKRLVDHSYQHGSELVSQIRITSLVCQIITSLASILIFIFGFFLGYTR